ncbi:hypothetical protein LJK88_50025 [Paenibacillus sp. P26]|nr:hypothetical protein LJK88_50025 [Paenibacillus sp. P26]
MIKAVRAVALTKKRVTAAWGETSVEIDCYDQIDLIVAEVEFGSVEEAMGFTAPHWFGPDISESRKYSNKAVWRALQTGEIAELAAALKRTEGRTETAE